MKIAVVGCGALGGYYGSLLCRAGHEVWFLLRSDYDVVRANGFQIRSATESFVVHPRCAREPGEIGPCELVLVCLKTTGNSALPKILPPLTGPATSVLTLQNGLGNEELIAAIVGAEKTLGGLCFVCLNRTAPGQVDHVAHGTIVLGEFGRPSSPRAHAIAELIKGSGVPCRVTENLAAAHWEKLVWNIPFNGLGVAGVAGLEAMESGKVRPEAKRGRCLTSDLLLDKGSWEIWVRELMLETIRAACALGLSVDESVADKQIARTREMGAYKASTLIDFELGRPLELESLFVEPLRQARRAGVACPRLANLCAVLGQLAKSCRGVR